MLNTRSTFDSRVYVDEPRADFVEGRACSLYFQYDLCGCTSGINVETLPTGVTERRQVISGPITALGHLLVADLVREKSELNSRTVEPHDKMWFSRTLDELKNKPVTQWVRQMRLTFDMETTARLPKLKGAVTPSRHHERRVEQVAPTMSVVPSKNDPDYGYYLLFCKSTLLNPDEVASNPASLAAWKAYLVRLKEELQTVTLILLIQCQEAKKKIEAKALEIAEAARAVEAKKAAERSHPTSIHYDRA